MTLNIWPFVLEDAVHHGISDAAIFSEGMVTDNAIFLRSERLDGSLRAEIEIVSAQTNNIASETVEPVAQKKEFACRVDV